LKAYYLSQGDLRKVAFIASVNVRTQTGGGQRGKVKGFSRPSRRRLLHLFGRLDSSKVRCVFLTLTFSKMDDATQAKCVFRRFRERLRRRFPKTSFVWRMERQSRGAIHFHLVLFNFPFVPQATLQTLWTKSTGEELSIVHVKLLRGRRRVFYYISKYCAKPSGEVLPSLDNSTYLHAKGKRSLNSAIEAARDRTIVYDHDEADGRIWGVFQKWALPWAQFRAWQITDFDHALYLRWRGLQTAKVTYCPSRYSNIQFLEFGGGGRSLAPPEADNELPHEVAHRLQTKYNWY